jgi:hypothetical protein
VEPTLLAELCTDVADLDGVLAALVRAQIFTVERDRFSSEQGRYQFVQSALRQVAYATLSRRDRKTIHVQLLDVMSREGSAELAPVAAQHCISAIEAAPDDEDVAELTRRAVGLLRQAAERARALGAPSEAVGHLARAVELAADERQRCEIQLAAAQACNDAGKYEQAAGLAEVARTGFEALADDDRAALAAAAWCVATTRLGGDLRTAVDLVEPYMRRLQEAPDKDAVLAPVLYAYLLAANGLGHTDYHLQLEQIKVADRLGDRAQVARAIGNLAVQLLRGGHEELGIVLLEKSTSVARECRDIAQLSFGLSNLASALAQRDAVAAARVADEAVEGAQRAGIAVSMSVALVNQVIGRWALGDWDTIERGVSPESLEVQDRAIVAAVEAMVLAARGRNPVEVLEGTPELDETAFYLNLARAVAQAFVGDRQGVTTMTAALEEAYDVAGIYEDFTLIYGAAMHIAYQFSDAELVDRLRRIVDDDGSTPPAGLAGHRALLDALAPLDEAGDGDPEASFREALAHYGAWGSPVHTARAQAAYGEWLTRHGRLEEAEPLRADARTTYAALGAVAWLEELDQAVAGHRVGS